MVDFSVLPEDCIAKVLSLITPRNVCRLNIVSHAVMAAANSDAVWDNFLPDNYHLLVSENELILSSKKELYLQLCDSPLLIDGGTKSFWLEKWSGKKCYMLGARDLTIIWGDTPIYWNWNSLRDTRFGEVAELMGVCWFEIRGKIETRMLSPDTTYAAYLVFKSMEEMFGFEYQPVEGLVEIGGWKGETVTMYLEHPEAESEGESFPPRESSGRYPNERADGWLEIEIGEVFNRSGDDGVLEVSLKEVESGSWKSGLILEGIEIRPKESY